MSLPARTASKSPAAIAEAMRALDRMESALHEAETFEDVQFIQRAAEAYKSLYHHYKAVSDRAGEVRITADRIIGTKLAERPRSMGAKPIGRSQMLRPTNDAHTYAEMGIPNRAQASRLQRIAAVPDTELKAAIETLKSDPGAQVTTAAVMRIITNQQHQDRVAAIRLRPSMFSSDGPFGTFVVDPPWPMQKLERDVRLNQASELDYPTMEPEELIEFWHRELAKRAEPDVHLFLWTTQKHLLFDAPKVLAGIGARPVFTMVWHKAGGFQPVGLAQYNSEFIVYARIGTPIFIDTTDFMTCFNAPRREHSRKPDQFYDTIRRVTGGPRIDVFAREAREGFAQYGNEIGKFN